MEAIWKKHFGTDTPAEINPEAYNSVVEIFEESCAKYGDNVAFSNFGKGLTYNQVNDLSRQFASYLQNGLGLQKGDRVAIMLPNVLAFPVAMFGILRAGLIQVNVNPLYTPRELEHQLNDADTDTIVIFSGSTPTLAEIIGKTSVKTVIAVGLDDLIGAGLPSPAVDARITAPVNFMDALVEGDKAEFKPVEITRDDLIYLQYTGGTTGLSKGAALSHGNLVANIMMYDAVAGKITSEGVETVITALPLYHIFALMVNCLSYFRYGATNVLITNPRDMAGFVKELSKWKFTAMTGVNTLYNGLLHTPGFADLDFSGLRVCWGGGSAIQEAVSNKWKEATGIHIKEGYGLSETSPILTMNPVALTEFTSTIGIPMPSTDISLRDDNGVEVGIGEAGELCAKGPQVMTGYWRKEKETADVMTADGYFRTGDIGVMDQEGFFKIVDRKKDMILVSGFNVFPNEIEAVVATMPGMLECACVGIPDEQTGEAVKLFAVVNDKSISIDDVRKFCKENLTGYKVPKQVVFLEELPKSTVGKILRRELRG